MWYNFGGITCWVLKYSFSQLVDHFKCTQYWSRRKYLDCVTFASRLQRTDLSILLPYFVSVLFQFFFFILHSSLSYFLLPPIVFTLCSTYFTILHFVFILYFKLFLCHLYILFTFSSLPFMQSFFTSLTSFWSFLYPFNWLECCNVYVNSFPCLIDCVSVCQSKTDCQSWLKSEIFCHRCKCDISS